jgi:mono/diheme cytochrome c family protein
MRRALALLLMLAAPVACMDPVHDDAVKALGPEAPGVPEGPLHRPGQPCVTCHGGEGPADAEFSLAGTVYLLQYQAVAAPNVKVVIEDIDGVGGTVTTNQAGSFWVNADQWRPKYPLELSVRYGNLTTSMNGNVGRAGSCADCHQLKAGSMSGAGPTSSGHIYVATSMDQLQKAMAPQ